MRRHAVRSLTLAVALIACSPAPAPERSRAPDVTPPAASVVVRPGPSSHAPGPDITVEMLGPEHVPSSSLRSFGSEIVWTAGQDSTADVWRYVVGGVPSRIYANPRRDTFIPFVARSERGHAFVETEDVRAGIGEWRIWFLPAGSTAPIEIDRGVAPNSGGPPGLAIDGSRLAWAGFEEPPEGPVSVLRVVDLDRLDDVQTLLRLPIEEALFWYPTLERDRLWYAAIDPDLALIGVGDEFHIESIDLAAPPPRRDRFRGTGNDFDFAIAPGLIVWKTVEPEFAAHNWGTLRLLERATGREILLGAERAMLPSIGNRFVTFGEITQKRLLVYDLAEQRLLDLSDELPDGTMTVSRPSVAGDLLTFMVATDGESPRLAWVLLPPR